MTEHTGSQEVLTAWAFLSQRMVATPGQNLWTGRIKIKRVFKPFTINPAHPDRVFAATTDGVYYSSNAGDSWTLVLEVPMATDVEINGDTIIAACGNLGSTLGGIYRSTDNGLSWQRFTSPFFPSSFQGKIELSSSPGEPHIVYASVGNGFVFADGATWLFKTTNAGKKWSLVSNYDYSKWQGWFSHDVAVHPNDPEQFMAVGIDIHRGHGDSLEQVSGGGVTLGIPPINKPDGPPDYSHSDHHVVLYHPRIPDLVLFGNDGGLFLSPDNGETFRSANGGLQTTQFYNGFSVSHQDPDFAMGGLQDNSTSLYRGSGAWQRAVGGDGSWTAINPQNDQLVFASSQYLNIVSSRDGGWSYFSNAPFHPDDNPIFIAPYVISPSNPNIMYAGGSFVHKSIDRGGTWVTVKQ